MQYISTRGNAAILSLSNIVLSSIASDGGLYCPSRIPTISNFQNLSYNEIVFKICKAYGDDSISEKDLKEIIEKSYSSFRHACIAPLKQIDRNYWIAELYHGPTFAFKDFALQFLGNLMSFYAQNSSIVIVGATSGDTGSAAIYGCKDNDNIQLFMMHPKGKISEIQRKQMTTIQNKNIHNIAIEGNFDDCQTIAKKFFAKYNDNSDLNLVAVNSINWIRILAQIGYYFYIANSFASRKVNFIVPTGNFGNALAGYIAKLMGANIAKIIVANNNNNFLYHVIKYGVCKPVAFSTTLSPAMDICIASNFERLLFYLSGHDTQYVTEVMQKLNSSTEEFALRSDVVNAIHESFEASFVTNADTMTTIEDVYHKTGEVIDPHTATATYLLYHNDFGLEFTKSENISIVLSTAHPAKFLDIVSHDIEIPIPDILANLHDLDEKYDSLPGSFEDVEEYILNSLKK